MLVCTSPRDKSLQQLLLRVFVSGLATPVSKQSLFRVLRLEEDFLENRMFALLDTSHDGFISLEEVLVALARAAAGSTLRKTMRMHAGADENLPGPADWEDSTDAVSSQAAFAFQLYDLDGNGELTAREVSVLVSDTMGGNIRAVDANIRAIGAVRNEAVDLNGFNLMAMHASNFLFPAFRLQQRLAQYGKGASASLAALRQFFAQNGLHGDGDGNGHGGYRQNVAPPPSRPPAMPSPAKRTPARKPRKEFDFGIEKPAEEQQAQARHVREEMPRPPPPQPQQQQQAAAKRRPPRNVEDNNQWAPAVNRRAAAFEGESIAEQQRALQPHNDGRWQAQQPPQAPPRQETYSSSDDDIVAAAFRAVRLGRAADLEACLNTGYLPIDIVFQPHGATLLHVAAAHGHRSLCKRLLSWGAPRDAVDMLGRTAAEVALAYRHWEVAATLRAAGVPLSPEAEMQSLRERAQWNAQQMVDAEWERGGDVGGPAFDQEEEYEPRQGGGSRGRHENSLA